MSDCTNLDMRDLLPDLARGALSGPKLVAVEQHLASCASCRAELELVRRAQALLGAAPPVDASRIAAAVVRSRAVRRTTTRRVWLAAASVVAIAGAALLATTVLREPGGADLPPVEISFDAPDPAPPDQPEPTEPVRASPRPPVRAELVVGGGVSDLADADLESLLGVLEGLDGQLDVEPAAFVPLLEGDV